MIILMGIRDVCNRRANILFVFFVSLPYNVLISLKNEFLITTVPHPYNLWQYVNATLIG